MINASGRGHWRDMFGEPGAEANSYAEVKRGYRNTAQRCEEAGVRCQPMVFEAQGGMTKEAGAILHTLAHAVAHAEHSDVQRCKSDLLQRIALAIARHGASAIKRRRAPATCADTAACQRVIDRSLTLEA